MEHSKGKTKNKSKPSNNKQAKPGAMLFVSPNLVCEYTCVPDLRNTESKNNA